MCRLAASLIAVCLVASTGGCGTIVNLASKEPSVYGGLKNDVEWFESYQQSGKPLASGTLGPGSSNQAAGVLCLVGLVLMEPVFGAHRRHAHVADHGMAREPPGRGAAPRCRRHVTGPATVTTALCAALTQGVRRQTARGKARTQRRYRARRKSPTAPACRTDRGCGRCPFHSSC